MKLRTKLIVAAVALLLTGTPAALFWLQNSARMTGLSLNMGFFATELAAPVPVPALMAVTFGVGLLVGAIGVALARRGGPNVPAPAMGPSNSDPWT